MSSTTCVSCRGPRSGANPSLAPTVRTSDRVGSVAATAARREDVAITGEVTWYASSPEARRGFCARCGSNLFWERPGSGGISIFAGTLDLPTGLRLKGHIHVAGKGDYYEIADGLPQAEAGDPEMTA